VTDNDPAEPTANRRDLSWEDVAGYFPQGFSPFRLEIAQVLPSFSANAVFDSTHVNPIGMVHGAVIAATMDVFMALLAAATAGGPQVTESLQVTYQRPWRTDRPVVFNAEVVATVGNQRTVEMTARQRAVIARAAGQFVAITIRDRDG